MSRKRCVDCEYRYAVGKSPRCTVCRKRRTRRQTHNAHLKRTYGISIAEYDIMFAAQDGKCFACGGGTSKNFLAVDHSHKTGEVRGLLCARCNKVLRDVRDRPEVLSKLAGYLKIPPARSLLEPRDWSKNLEVDREKPRKKRRRR